jgi:hypothetical protein
VDAPGRRSAPTGLAPGWPAGLAALKCHAFRFTATELKHRHRPRGHNPAVPTAPPELRRAVDLAPRGCPIQPRRRCRALRGKADESSMARTTELAPPNGQDRPLQPHAAGRRAGRVDRRRRRPHRNGEQEQRAPRCSLLMRGAARHRVDRRCRFALSERVGVSLQDSSKGRASRVRGVGGDTAASPRAKRASARGRSARLDVVRSGRPMPRLGDARLRARKEERVPGVGDDRRSARVAWTAARTPESIREGPVLVVGGAGTRGQAPGEDAG